MQRTLNMRMNFYCTYFCVDAVYALCMCCVSAFICMRNGQGKLAAAIIIAFSFLSSERKRSLCTSLTCKSFQLDRQREKDFSFPHRFKYSGRRCLPAYKACELLCMYCSVCVLLIPFQIYWSSLIPHIFLFLCVRVYSKQRKKYYIH